jgi:hypothetical protein
VKRGSIRNSVLVSCALCALALGVVGCGGGGGGRLSSSDYKAELAKISKQSDAAHAAIARSAPKATTVAQVQAALRRFADAEDRLGDEVSRLKAPTNAEAANAELARGEHDDAAEIRALLPKLAGFKSVQQAFGYLQQLGSTKGGHEEDQAIAKLKKLGYTSGS